MIKSELVQRIAEQNPHLFLQALVGGQLRVTFHQGEGVFAGSDQLL